MWDNIETVFDVVEWEKSIRQNYGIPSIFFLLSFLNFFSCDKIVLLLTTNLVRHRSMGLCSKDAWTKCCRIDYQLAIFVSLHFFFSSRL